MTSMLPQPGFAALIAAAALAFTSPSLAEMVHFKASANASQEVPVFAGANARSPFSGSK